jgi:hypothetical protein
VLANGARAAREFSYGDPEWFIELPAAALATGDVDLTLEINEPRSPVELGWSQDDDRRLGVLVRAITVLPADDDAARAGLGRERRRARWAARAEGEHRRLPIRPGETVELAGLSDYGGFGSGWMLYPDQAGVWTEGSRSELALELDGMDESDFVLVLSLDTICVRANASLTVEVLVNGERADIRDFSFGDSAWRIASPVVIPPDGKVDLTFIIEEPTTPRALGWSADELPLGILLRSITLEEVDRSVRPEEKIVFSDDSGADRLLGNGWSEPEPTGVWTDGSEASLVLKLTAAPPRGAELVLGVTPFVTPRHPELEVEVSALGEQLGRQVFHQGKADRLLRGRLPGVARAQGARIAFELRLRDPARPAHLGLSDDERSLGVHLQWLMVGKVTRRELLWGGLRGTVAKVRNRLT